jgi:hypothetical protein
VGRGSFGELERSLLTRWWSSDGFTLAWRWRWLTRRTTTSCGAPKRSPGCSFYRGEGYGVMRKDSSTNQFSILVYPMRILDWIYKRIRWFILIPKISLRGRVRRHHGSRGPARCSSGVRWTQGRRDGQRPSACGERWRAHLGVGTLAGGLGLCRPMWAASWEAS